VRGMDLDSYLQDAKTQAAVERKVLTISEGWVKMPKYYILACLGEISAASATGSDINTTESIPMPRGSRS